MFRYFTRFALAAVSLFISTDAVSADNKIDFNRDIRPILSNTCFKCHGPAEKDREADLRFDQESSAKSDLGGYRAIVPGKPDESALIERITSKDPDEMMPPADSGKKLTPQQIELLREWIKQGASWSKHWAYIKPVRHPEPKIKNEQWPLGWIDKFILHRLEAEGLTPAEEANRVTLIRRLKFDLVGLPPTPKEVDQFVADKSDRAYEKLVDRLLASPHFGERMAMVWLDLVRYADTVGYHGDQDQSISPYRDWVIDAFNDNKRFDQFTREQLAGDLLPNSDVDQKIATGYNRLLQTSHEGGVQPKEYLAIYAADRVRNLSVVWMGATLGCTQCHDHKYDPFTSRDFYSMVAIFADIDEAQHFKVGSNALPTRRPPELKVLSKRQRAEIAKLENVRKDLQSRIKELEKSAAAGAAEQTKQLTSQLDETTKKIAAIQKAARSTMITVAIKPRTIRFLPRGDWLNETGPIMQAALPASLPAIDVGKRRITRLDLANWLVDEKKRVGGLTARVFVNRFWYLMFGTGISKSLDDFGGQGKPPVHPELLDNLAVEFVGSGWNVKQMLKLMVMSRAYRQSSHASPELLKRDPYNQLVARQSRFRLPAEMVRDNALLISDLLVPTIGGASIKPYQPAGYYKHLNFPPRKYHADKDSRQWRRGVYVHWQRQFLHPMFRALDAPTREECTVERPRSNTPLAALALLNDPTFVEAARALAEKTIREGGKSTESRLTFAFRRAVSRKPDKFELDALRQLLASVQKQYKADPKAARRLIATGFSPVAKDLDPIEWAAWTGVSRALLNLNETITRN